MSDATETARSVEAERPPDGGLTKHETDATTIIRAVTAIMATVVGLTFMFGFGNVLNLALRLGVPVWVAPLVAPAVDLSIVGLLLGTRHLALTGASPNVLRPARRLLIFASVATLALNVAEPVVAGEYGKAAFDAVGPLLLIGWSEVGPGLLQAISTTSPVMARSEADRSDRSAMPSLNGATSEAQPQPNEQGLVERRVGRLSARRRSPEELLAQARKEDAAHRTAQQKPISAETLRVRLGVGAARARRLVKIVRTEFETQSRVERPENEPGGEIYASTVSPA